MTRPPEFSVVIPAFRATRTIEAAVASVLAQTTPPLEVIVIDDGCPDGTGDVVERTFPTVQVVRQENAGEGAARNTGIRLSKASWIAFLDADDLWFPHHLETLGQLRRTCPAARLISTGHIQHEPWRGLDRRPVPTRKGSEIDYLSLAGRRVGLVWSSAAAVDRAVAADLGGFGPWRAGADLEFWARVALHHPVAVTKTTTAIYRRGVGGVMEAIAAERADGTTKVAIAGLRGVSPSTDTVLDALASGRSRLPRASLRSYVDGRITSGWRSAMLAGEARGARRLWGDLHRRWRPSALRWLLAAHVPAGLAQGLVHARQRLRGAVR